MGPKTTGILIILIIFIIFIIFIIELPWTGNIPYSLKNNIKNELIKKKHTIFNVPLNINICKENLEIIASILNQCNLMFWLSEGTALGAVRNKNFITYDDDVDLGMWYSDFNKFRRLALPIIRKNGFTVDQVKMSNSYVTISRKGEKIDIDFTDYNIECAACGTSNANCKNCNILIDKLSNMSYLMFLGKSYLCPGIEYLEYLYGPNWRTPLKQK